MKLILLRDIHKLGFIGDIVAVKPGYARNFLIPRGHAKMATEGALKTLSENNRQRKHKEEKLIEVAKKMVEKVQSLEIMVSGRADEKGYLFGSVTGSEVADFLSKNGAQVDKKFITTVPATIKTTGQYEAIIRLHKEVIEKVKFSVVATPTK